MPTLRNLALAGAGVSALAGQAAALVLQELSHSDGLKYTKRGDPMGCLDLRSQESFVWGAADDNQAALGNLTVFMPDEQENIVSMERFNGMLTSVNCTQTTIDMAFRDDNTFAYAKEVWDWVNGADNHTFVMVAGTGACGWNEHRQPFTVSTLSYDEEANVAHLAAVAQDWTQAIHTYTLNVGGMPSDGLHKRSFGEIDYNKDLSLDFNHQFPVDTISLPMPDGVTATLDMSNCSTAGSFAFQFTLETILLIPKSAEMSVHPQGVSVTVAPTLLLTGNIAEPKTGDLTLARINLAGIQIPAGILDIGPEIVLSVGATIGPLQGQATIEAGVVYSLEDSAVATIDVLGGDADQSGWTPTVQTTPLTVEAELTATVKAFVKAELELAAKAFGTGFDLGIGLAPYLAADLQTVTAQSGSCGASDGLTVDPSYGVDLILDAHTPTHGEDDPLFSITLASLSQPLPSTCLPFGETGIVPVSSSAAPISSSPPISAAAFSSAWLSSTSASSTWAASSTTAIEALPTSSAAAGYQPYWPVASSSASTSPVVTSSSSSALGYQPYWPAVASSSVVASPLVTSSSSVAGGYVPYQPYVPSSWSSSTFSTVASSSTSSSVSSWPNYAGYGHGGY